MRDADAGTAPDWISREDAYRRIGEELNRVLDRAAATPKEADQPALALRVSAGVGKTAGALDVLAERGEELLNAGHVLFFTPSHDLATQVLAEFQSKTRRLPSVAIRGRTATDPATGGKLCSKPELAETLGQSGRSVGASLCSARDESGEVRDAPCRAGCAYFAQMPLAPSIIFLAHAYLQTRPPIQGGVALRIIDEKCVDALICSDELGVEHWLREPARMVAKDAPGIREARETVLAALRMKEPVVKALRDRGFGQKDLRAFATAEAAARPEMGILPWMSADAQMRSLREADAAAMKASEISEAVWSMLADRDANGHDGTERLTINGAAGKEAALVLHARREMPRDAPLVLLDANADPLITEAIAPGAVFVALDVKPRARVVQVRDRTFSNNFALGRDTSVGERAKLRAVIQREAARAEYGALLVATRKVLRQLHEDLDPEGDFSSDEALLRPLLGAQPRWFGPRLQGLNDYKHCDVAILVGRLEPPAQVIESKMRALFGDGDTPLVTVSGATQGCASFPDAKGAYLTDEGALLPARLRQHPDQRGAALLHQVREASSIQAIARLRAVHADLPKKIFVISSLPLPDVPVSDLITWRELVDDQRDEPFARQRRRLERAIFRAGSEGPVPGLRLSRRTIGLDAPETFRGKTGGEAWARDLTDGMIRRMVEMIAENCEIPATFIRLRREGGRGRATPAVVFVPPDRVDETVALTWPKHNAQQG